MDASPPETIMAPVAPVEKQQEQAAVLGTLPAPPADENAPIDTPKEAAIPITTAPTTNTTSSTTTLNCQWLPSCDFHVEAPSTTDSLDFAAKKLSSHILESHLATLTTANAEGGNESENKQVSCSWKNCLSTPFSSVLTLQNHIRDHSREVLFTCPTCQRKFTSKTNYVIHRRTHHSLMVSILEFWHQPALNPPTSTESSPIRFKTSSSTLSASSSSSSLAKFSRDKKKKGTSYSRSSTPGLDYDGSSSPMAYGTGSRPYRKRKQRGGYRGQDDDLASPPPNAILTQEQIINRDLRFIRENRKKITKLHGTLDTMTNEVNDLQQTYASETGPHTVMLSTELGKTYLEKFGAKRQELFKDVEELKAMLEKVGGTLDNDLGPAYKEFLVKLETEGLSNDEVKKEDGEGEGAEGMSASTTALTEGNDVSGSVVDGIDDQTNTTNNSGMNSVNEGMDSDQQHEHEQDQPSTSTIETGVETQNEESTATSVLEEQEQLPTNDFMKIKREHDTEDSDLLPIAKRVKQEIESTELMESGSLALNDSNEQSGESLVANDVEMTEQVE